MTVSIDRFLFNLDVSITMEKYIVGLGDSSADGRRSVPQLEPAFVPVLRGMVTHGDWGLGSARHVRQGLATLIFGSAADSVFITISPFAVSAA